MVAGYVQVPVDSSGKKVDTVEFVRADNLTVERQTVAIPDPVTINSDTQRQILIELRVQTALMCAAFNLPDSLDDLRTQLDPLN